MKARSWLKVAITVALLALLIAFDGVSALHGLPLLAVALGLALMVGDSARAWLRARGRATLAMLPFMAAALVLMFSFCKGRDLSQGVLFLVTAGLVFDILLIALAVIAEIGKRKYRGVLEFAGALGAGLMLGFGLSLVFLLGAHQGGMSLAGP